MTSIKKNVNSITAQLAVASIHQTFGIRRLTELRSYVALSVMGSVLKYMYFKEYFKYMLSILQCVLNTFVVFVI